MHGGRLSGVLRTGKGTLRVRAWGASVERFISLCGHKDILLWNICRDGGEYRMSVSLPGFYRMREIARKTGTRVVIAGRCGLPFFLPRFRRHAGFAAGFLLAAAVWFGARAFVWDIDLDGNLRISDDQLYSFLGEQGIYVGMPASALDIEALEKALRLEFDQVTWTSARLSGVRLYISLKENELTEPADTLETAQEATSLVSEYAGTIVEMIVRKGVPMVGIGDRIEAGTLLVDGLVPVYSEDQTVSGYQPTQSDADIVLEHQRVFRAGLPYETIAKTYTGREKHGFLVRIGSREWQMAAPDPYLNCDTVTTITRPAVFAKLDLPVWFGRISQREYQNIEKEYTVLEVETLLFEKCDIFLEDLAQKGVQIIEKNVTIDSDDSGWYLEGIFRVREKVGQSVAAAEGEPVSNE